MNKMFKVILLSAVTAAFGFIGCGGGEDIENQAVAGAPTTGPVTTPAAGSTSSPAAAGAPASSAGATVAMAGAPAAGNSSGCSVSYGATSRGALTGLALALGLALAARRRRS